MTALPEKGPAAGFGPDPGSRPFPLVGCTPTRPRSWSARTAASEVMATGIDWVKLLVDASGPYLTVELEEIPEEQGDEAGTLAEGVLRAFRNYQKWLAGRGSVP